MEDPRFDGLFMSAIQQSQGIENFFNNLFSFMRRKTDFYSAEDKSFEVVNKHMKHHAELFGQDKQRQELIKQKQEQARAQATKETPVIPPTQEAAGATVEEIDDDEAKRIEQLQELRKKQQEAKNKPKEEKGEDQEAKEEDNLKQKPNAGNGGQTEKYYWTQTLDEVTVNAPLPFDTTAKMLDVTIKGTEFKLALKGKANEPIIEGKWHKKINVGETFWNVERDGSKSIFNLTLEKSEGKCWWNCLL